VLQTNGRDIEQAAVQTRAIGLESIDANRAPVVLHDELAESLP
jgi:hypothetical protein